MQEIPHHTPKEERATGMDNGESPEGHIQDIVDRQQFMDDNLSDVMRNSALASNISSLLNITTATTQQPEHKVTLDWIIPDGLNSKLEDVETKRIADFLAPGTNNGPDCTDTKYRTFFQHKGILDRPTNRGPLRSYTRKLASA